MRPIFWFFSLLFTSQISWSDCYQLIHQPLNNHIVLVVDRSGSMSGQPMAEAKKGVKAFLRQMKASDQAALIAFDDRVNLIQTITSNPAQLINGVDQISLGGATALYDALVRAAHLLHGTVGNRLIIYLTDGQDNRSRYRLSELEQMSVSERVFIYGIGLGSVDVDKLTQLSQRTNGVFEHTRRASELQGLYLRVLSQYNQRYGQKQASSGSLVIKSIPTGREAIIQGRKVGLTPYQAVGLKPGQLKVGIVYSAGIWECQAVVQAGHRTLIDSRQSDLGAQLIILSRPQGATVFMDQTYLGITAIGNPVSPGKSDWVSRARADGRQLRVRSVPYGNHRFRLKGIPDFDFGPQQEIEIQLSIQQQEMILLVDILRQKVTDGKGKTYVVGKPKDPFQELEGDFENDSDFEGLEDF
jgi:uncharacterized protein YegL